MSDGRSLAEEMKLFVTLGVGLATTIAAFLFQKDELVSLLKTDPALGLLSIALIGVTFWWLLTWLFFGYKEIKFLADFIEFDPRYINPSGSSHQAFPLFIAIGFGVMIGFGMNLSIYIGAVLFTLSVAMIGDCVATKLMAEDLFHKKAFQSITIDGSPEQKNLIDTINDIRHEIEKYYFESLYFAPKAISMCLLAVAWLVYHGIISIGSMNSVHLAYILTILAILVTEVPLRVLRHFRNKNVVMILCRYPFRGNEPSLSLLKSQALKSEYRV